MAITYKNQADITMMARASQALVTLMRSVAQSIQPGITTAALDAEIEHRIAAAGATPALRGLAGQRGPYPCCSCMNVNDQVTNCIPTDRPLEHGDLLKVQVALRLNGWYSKIQQAYPIGHLPSNREKLLRVTKAALQAGVEQVRPGGTLLGIANAVQTVAEGGGFSVVREFVGHGIGKALHEEPMVPSFRSSHLEVRNLTLKPGLVLQILPLLNEGSQAVRVGADGWSITTADGKDSCLLGHIVALGADGPLVLTEC